MIKKINPIRKTAIIKIIPDMIKRVLTKAPMILEVKLKIKVSMFFHTSKNLP